jgi:hypothetical protein
MNNLLEFFFTIIGVFFCIFIHELGHLTAGKVVRIEFQNMFVGPLKFSFGGNLKVNLNTNFYYSLGVCINPKIKGTYLNLIDRYFIVLFGGPSISLIFGIIMLIFGRYYNVSLLFILGLISIGISVATCFSDGKKAIELKRSKNKTLSECEIIKTLLYSNINDNELQVFTCNYFDKLENGDKVSINNIKINELWARCVLAKIPNIKKLNYINGFVEELIKIKDEENMKNNQVYILQAIYTGILYIALEEKDLNTAKRWYESIKKVRVNKMLEYEWMIVDVFINQKDLNTCYKALDKLNKVYMMEGYIEMEKRIIEKIEKLISVHHKIDKEQNL